MRTILCYGDSNTWGYIPGTGQRFSRQQRWPGILQRLLGDAFYVVEEGLNGRTTVWDDPFKPGRNGLAGLQPALDSHAPLDLVILMLGTNDLKHYRSAYAADCARGMELLIETVSKSAVGPSGGPPRILLVAPPVIGELSAQLSLQFRDAREKSREFASCFGELAQTTGCLFLDAAKIVEPSATDGVHLDEVGHERLAHGIAEAVFGALGDKI